MLEQKIQARILKELKKHGIWAVKIITANRNGVPDILACWEGKFIAIEVKRPGGKLAVLQQIQIDRINAAGGVAIVATSWEEVKELFSL